ncbi:hypothetical protein HEK616_40390 [Streptomyces nigrescens]|uniref:Uncharacterized protein n=1 Tax=Streptomyces nigrescens TaxID=1920 RepID=A0ABM7ZW16_STRNI|nr:hypothetical protein [Streptomyces nigrescens]BDM70552.1 hypothetical protein HEK616_40390 [Streptomyces nigrescens]
MTTTLPVTALELIPGDRFTHHGREWVVVDVLRGRRETAFIKTEGGGLVYIDDDREFHVRRPSKDEA